ncbi:dipeptide/oligopeptide/nickel ABC transporter ATP-binding protein [Kribbella sp.]|uniref:ABC transporter ATP-binding protein n=1 Tax=Kribbella sp. TaxID=1871183 RepID=UPI002D6AC8A9|nr:dipeptide/oligopeptide/nickel ABC transporter ATP-binding protein [Kribbella sp.]HZX08252.1 dipeptide/oligopeptide/nickel ABC transporter ATP-binding protein [Kribbella sp.]
MSYIVETTRLSHRYRTGQAPALDNIDLRIEQGTTLGLVGESGSGKSTLIRLMCGLVPAPAGAVRYQDRDVSHWLRQDGRTFRKQNQLVFQNPASSFDPRMSLATALAEPVKALERRTPSQSELADRLEQVGLNAGILDRHPHQLSGGQVQRVAIARALLVGPQVLYADEPTSALDVSVQAQVLNLLMELRQTLGLTLVVVSHDLALVSRVCDQIAVMLSGSIVEAGSTAEVLRDPGTPYTRQLLAAAELVTLTQEDRNR